MMLRAYVQHSADERSPCFAAAAAVVVAAAVDDAVVVVVDAPVDVGAALLPESEPPRLRVYSACPPGSYPPLTSSAAGRLRKRPNLLKPVSLAVTAFRNSSVQTVVVE